MAISTLAGAVSGLRPTFHCVKSQVNNVDQASGWHSTWGVGGSTGTGTYDTTLNGVTLSSTSAQVAGQIYFQNPASGNTYLASMRADHVSTGTETDSGQTILADRIWHNGGYTITSTSAQNSTTPTWPARDANGSTNGVGVLLALEVSAACGAAAPTITVSYTNSAGTSGRTATNILATANSPPANRFFVLDLQAGDDGVRSVQSLTLSASWISGTINLVAFRPLVGVVTNNGVGSVDALTSGFPRLYDGSVPFIILTKQHGSSHSTSISQVSFTQG